MPILCGPLPLRAKVRPVLFEIGDTIVWSHPFFSLLGLAAALAISWQIAKSQRRADNDFFLILAGGLFLAAIFSRFGLVFRYIHDVNAPTFAGFLAYSGKTVLGGLAGGYAGVLITKRLIGYKRHTGDLLAPGVACGMAIGRIGCFLSERPGTRTSLPWAVSIPPAAARHIPACPDCIAGVPLHPSFLYEALFLAVAALILFRVIAAKSRRELKRSEGHVFKIFLFSYAVFRFFVEFVRGNPPMAFGMSGSQLMILATLPLFALYFVRRSHVRFQTIPFATGGSD